MYLRTSAVPTKPYLIRMHECLCVCVYVCVHLLFAGLAGSVGLLWINGLIGLGKGAGLEGSSSP